MTITNKLIRQVDLPVWEWCRLMPNISQVYSASCTADNSLYHVSFGRYIYIYGTYPTAAAGATGTGINGFFRYDTVTDTYQMLTSMLSTQIGTCSGMQFAGGQGYLGNVLSADTNTITCAGLTGQTLKSFDIRIIGGAGIGQQRIITAVSNPTIHYTGTVTTLPVTPQGTIIDANANWTINQWAGYQVRFVHASGQSQVRKIIYNSATTLYFADVAKFAEDRMAWSPIVTITGSVLVIGAVGTPYQIESSVLTVDSPWLIQPDNTSQFVIRTGGIWMSSAGTASYSLLYYDVAADQWYLKNGASATSPVLSTPTEINMVNSGENATVWDRGVALGTHSTTTLEDTTKNWTINQWTGYNLRIFSGTGENQLRKILSNTTTTLTWVTPGIAPDATSRYFIEAFEAGTITSINPSVSSTAISANALSGVINTTDITTALVNPINCNGWYISGTGITVGTTIVSGQGTKNLTLSANNISTVSGTLILSPVAISATAASGTINTYVITTNVAVPANCNNWYISGTGIGLGAIIISGQNTTSLTLSMPNTATVSGTLYLYPTNPYPSVFTTEATGSISSTSITTTLATPVNCIGWYASGVGIANNAIITAGAGTTGLTLSIANSGAVSGNIILSPSVVSATATSGVADAFIITTNENTPFNCNGWNISGTGIKPNTVIISGQGTDTLTLSQANIATVSGTLIISATTISTGTISGNILTAGNTTGAYYPGQILSGTGIMQTNSVITNATVCFTTGLVTTINVTTGSTSGIVAGMVPSIIAGTGAFAVGTKVVSVTNNTVVLNTNVTTAIANATIQFTTVVLTNVGAATSVGNIVTLSSGNTSSMVPGMFVSIVGGSGVLTAGTYILAILSTTQFTLSTAPTTAITAGSNYILCQPYQTVITNQLTGIPGGAGTYSIWPSQTVASTTISGTGISMVTDNTKYWVKDRWNNYCIRIKSGTGIGQVRQILDTTTGPPAYVSAIGATSSGVNITVGDTTNLVAGMIISVLSGVGEFVFGTTVLSVTNTTTFVVSTTPVVPLSGGATIIIGSAVNTLKVFPAWTILPDNTSIYAIHGDTDKIYMHIAPNHATYIHNIESDIITTGRMLDWGSAKGTSVQYSDYLPLAISAGISVMPIASVVGYTTPVATTSGTTTSNISTIAYSGPIFPVGSWIVIAGATHASYNGTWQVIASGPNSVSFYNTVSGANTITVQGTIGQQNSYIPGGTLASGAFATLGATTTISTFGCIPALYNNASIAVANAIGGYVSDAGATSSGTTISVTSSVGLKAGMIPVVTVGVGTFATGTVILTVPNGVSFTVNNAPSVALSGGSTVITCTPSIAIAGTATGQLTTSGFIQKIPQAISSGSRSGTATATIVLSTATWFPVGSWITVTGCTPGSYNGVFQVTASTAGSTSLSYVTSVSATDTITIGGTIGLATNAQLVTTVNSHNLKAGQLATIRGDTGYSASANNITATVTPLPAVLNQFTYPTIYPSAPMVVYAQTTLQLIDANKNWIPNQWAGCLVTYNSTQITAATATVQPSILSAYILSNTSNVLIFAAVQSTAPIQGVSRYVITTPATYAIGNTLGNIDGGLALGVQATTSIVDVTKSWLTPAIVSISATTINAGSPLATLANITGLYPGMIAAITAGGASLPVGATILSINQTTLVVTMSQNFTSGPTATISFAAVCNSSGTNVTLSGYTTQGLSVGMYLGVTSVANISPMIVTAGAFVANGGTNLTQVKVTAITSPTTFTISSIPTTPLVNATIQASFWIPGQHVNRIVRFLTGSSSVQVATITANTVNSLTFSAITAPIHGSTAYMIGQQPNRGNGSSPIWNFGASNPLKIGRYLYQARGGNLPGWDRLDFSTDKWEFLTPTPTFEGLSGGAMYAYDGGDRIYFTPQVTQRVYYLNIEDITLNGGSQYPYVAGTAIVGNRMEIFTTVDGLKYLWLNRHNAQECFKLLLFF